MRRRRQKNTLLPKMLGVATVIVAILLPLLAQLGVFKVVRQRLTPITLVKLPPPEKRPPVKKKTPPKKRVAKARPRPSGRKPAGRPPVAARPNPNQPKVVASAGSGGDGPTVDNSGTATPGQVAVPVTPAPALPPESPPAPPPTPAPPPAPVLPAPPASEPPPAPRIPVLTPAVALAQPRPVLPDDLRDQERHGTFRAVFTVHADGTADVKMASSTGNPALDDLAMTAARRWTFRPATRDGAAVDSFLRLTVEFEVT